MNIKQTVLKVFNSVGGMGALNRFNRNQAKVLLYHRFSDHNIPYRVQRSAFEKQVQYIAKNYHNVTMSTLVDVAAANKSQKNLLAVTVDDGYEDFFVHAYPILKKYNVPATLYVATDFVQRKASMLWPDELLYQLSHSVNKKLNILELGIERASGEVELSIESSDDVRKVWLLLAGKYCKYFSLDERVAFFKKLFEQTKVHTPNDIPDYKPISWPQLREISDAGIEIASHGCSHTILTKLTLNQCKHELEQSKKVLESQLQLPIKTFGYPNGQVGDYNDDIINEVKSAGYLGAAVAFDDGANASSNLFTLRRKVLNGSYIAFKRYLAGI